MKTKTLKKEVFRTISIGTKDVTVFEASDGREFESKKDCELYETALEDKRRFDAIKTVRFDIDGGRSLIPEIWYMAKSDDELEIVKREIGFYNKSDYVWINDIAKGNNKKGLSLGEWMGSVIVDGGDSKDDLMIYTASYLKEKLSPFIEFLMNEGEIEGK